MTGNQFSGNGPRRGGPPNFAVWAHEDSTLNFSGNQIDGWRHALSASNAKTVRAIDNTTSRFIGTAIVVNNSTLPAYVTGNVAVTENEQDQSVRVTGPQEAIVNNVLRKPNSSEEASTSEN